jgi:hypothetical protein
LIDVALIAAISVLSVWARTSRGEAKERTAAAKRIEREANIFILRRIRIENVIGKGMKAAQQTSVLKIEEE